jgi:hypothetical protein
MALSLVSQAHYADEEVRLFGSFNRAGKKVFPFIGNMMSISVFQRCLCVPSFIIKKTMQPPPQPNAG